MGAIGAVGVIVILVVLVLLFLAPIGIWSALNSITKELKKLNVVTGDLTMQAHEIAKQINQTNQTIHSKR